MAGKELYIPDTIKSTTAHQLQLDSFELMSSEDIEFLSVQLQFLSVQLQTYTYLLTNIAIMSIVRDGQVTTFALI